MACMRATHTHTHTISLWYYMYRTDSNRTVAYSGSTDTNGAGPIVQSTRAAQIPVCVELLGELQRGRTMAPTHPIMRLPVWARGGPHNNGVLLLLLLLASRLALWEGGRARVIAGQDGEQAGL